MHSAKATIGHPLFLAVLAALPGAAYAKTVRVDTEQAIRRLLQDEDTDGDEKTTAGFGLMPEIGDIDGDGDLDILCPGKSGLYLFEQIP